MNTFAHLYQVTTEEAEAEAARIRPDGDYVLECLGASPDGRGTWIVDWTKAYYVVSSGHPVGEVYDREVRVVEDLPGKSGSLPVALTIPDDYVFSKVIEFPTLKLAREYADHLVGNS